MPFRFLRVGSMIMLLHDPSDIILEVTKMLNYAEWELSSTVMFVVFMLSWLLTRLVYFPFWIVWSTRSVSQSLKVVCMNAVILL